MAKQSGKNRKGKTTKAKTRTKPATPKNKPAPTKSEPIVIPPLLQSIGAKHFWYTFGTVALIVMVLALQSGVNGDDLYQVDYSEKLMDYYGTMGQDTAALFVDKGNMHLYGGFFEIVAGATTRVFQLEPLSWSYHVTRHFWIAFFGILTLLFTALTARKFGGWPAALLALLLLFLSPRFLGHSLINPKDIPFACGFMMSIYFACRWLEEIPKVSIATMAGLAGGIAIAVGTRVGGLLAVALFGLFGIVSFLLKVRQTAGNERAGLFGRYALYGFIPIAVGLGGALLFWPFALVDPVAHIQEALAAFSNLKVEIRVLFGGENVMSTDAPASYFYRWFFRTIPLYALLGLLGTLVAAPFLWRRYGKDYRLLFLLMAGVFPGVYIVLKDSTLHDGWRHMIFVYPPLVVLISLFWNYILEQFLPKGKNWKYGVLAVLGLLIVEPASFIAANTSFPYLYFNPAFGGVKGAYGQYELDYWGVSAKKAADWMIGEGLIPQENDTITVMTNFYFNVDRYLRRRFDGKVKIDYVAYDKRFEKDWDYGIFVNRFIDGTQLRHDGWPSSRAIHTIDIGGKSICAVYERGDGYAFQGKAAEKARDWPTAIRAYTQETAVYGDNELAWLGLANANLSSGNFSGAQNAAEQALMVNPGYASAFYYQAMVQFYQQKPQQAAPIFEKVVELDERFYLAHFFLGQIYKDRNELTAAFNYARRSIEINPRFKQGYQLLAEIYEKNGDPQKAQEMRARAAAF
ncbi:MAG: tetratricopeptide repeat protein [Bacteroidota bacterium]